MRRMSRLYKPKLIQNPIIPVSLFCVQAQLPYMFIFE